MIRIALLVALLSLAPSPALSDPFRIAVNGGSATAFLQSEAAAHELIVIEVTDQQLLANQPDPETFDLLLLMGGGGRSDGQLIGATVRGESPAGEEEPAVAESQATGQRRGRGRRGGGGRTITPTQAEEVDQFLGAVMKKEPPTPVVATPRVYEALLRRRPDLTDNPRLTQDEQFDQYLGRGQASRENFRRLLGYLAIAYAGRPGEAQPPAPVRTDGFYHPDYGDFFPTVEAFVEWNTEREINPAAPRVVVLANYTHFLSRNQQGIDAMLRELTRRGALAACVIQEDPTSQLLLLEYEPDIVIDAFHRGDDIEFRQQLDVPHLQALWLSGRQTIEDWREGATRVGSFLGVETGEALGSIEPHIVAGRSAESAVYEPIPDRVERIVGRALAWANLRNKPNAEKQIVMLTSGGAGGDLDVLKSQLKLLKRLKEADYPIADLPRDEAELEERIEAHGRQFNPPEMEQLDQLARSGKAALIPAAVYRQWFKEKVPPDQRRLAVEQWGEAPGEVMTWTDDAGEPFLVVPKIELGAVTLVPKPTPWSGDRLRQFDKRKRDGGSPPSHNVLATYFWLQEESKADGLVVWGTLGFDLLSPGKSIGLRSSDWPDILMGDLPSVRPYSLGAITFALPAKRRAKAVLVDYLPAPRLSVGLDDELFALQNELVKWNRVGEGVLKEKFRESITDTVRQLRLDKDLEIEPPADDLLTDGALESLAALLAEYEDERVDAVKHVLGEPPPKHAVVPYLMRCLGERFLDELQRCLSDSQRDARLPGDARQQLVATAHEAIESIIRSGLNPEQAAESVGVAPARQTQDLLDDLLLAANLNNAFRRSGDEIERIVAALEGRFIPPGPAAPPERNPASVPTGRNMYVLNPEEIPSRQSWEIGVRLVDELLARSRDENGGYPRRIAYTIRTRATMSDFGVSEAQILYTLGVRPVWGRSGRVSEIEIIPREELGRPRIDIFVEPKHHYADYLDSRMRLIDQAVCQVADLDEPDNYVRQHRAEVQSALVASGVGSDQARLLATARLFGVAPERFGSGLHDRLFGETGIWDNEDQLVDVYVHQHAFAYTEGLWGVESAEGFRRQVATTDAVVRSMSRGSALSGRAAYSGGMLKLVAERIGGARPSYYLADLRNPGAEQMMTAEQAVRRALRTELLNSKWITAKMAKQRGGATAVNATLGRVLDWRITTPAAVDEAIWNDLAGIYLRDNKGLGVASWLEQSNPDAYQGVLETFLEAIRKGYWNAEPTTLADLAARHAELQSATENDALAQFVSTNAPKLQPAVEERAPATEPASDSTRAEIEGRLLTAAPAATLSTGVDPRWWILGGAILLVALGSWLKVGSAKLGGGA